MAWGLYSMVIMRLGPVRAASSFGIFTERTPFVSEHAIFSMSAASGMRRLRLTKLELRSAQKILKSGSSRRSSVSVAR